MSNVVSPMVSRLGPKAIAIKPTASNLSSAMSSLWLLILIIGSNYSPYASAASISNAHVPARRFAPSEAFAREAALTNNVAFNYPEEVFEDLPSSAKGVEHYKLPFHRKQAAELATMS